MHGSNWRVITALAGLALVIWVFAQGILIGLSYYPQEDRYQSYRYATDQPTKVGAGAAGIAAPQSFEYRTPCRDPKGHDESDLCAQWKAANAAADSAAWAKWSFWISLAGGIGLFATLYYTRKAVLAAENATQDADIAITIAERNARAAERQAEVAQMAARIQLRAYLIAENFVPSSLEAGVKFGIDFRVRNQGATPATNVIVVAYVGTRPKPHDDDFLIAPDAAEGASLSVVPAQGQILVPAGYGVTTTQEMVDAFNAGVYGFYCWGVVTYEDVFGEPHATRFRIELEPDMRTSHCPGGNGAD